MMHKNWTILWQCYFGLIWRQQALDECIAPHRLAARVLPFYATPAYLQDALLRSLADATSSLP